MIIGDPATFAVEVDPDRPPRHEFDALLVWGHCCFWIGGRQVGDRLRAQRVRLFWAACETIVEHSGARGAPELEHVSAEAVYREIDYALYGELAADVEEANELWRTYGPHVIHPQGVEAFDGYKVYCVENAREARIVWRHAVENMLHEARIPAGELDTVLTRFRAWFDQMFPIPPGIKAS